MTSPLGEPPIEVVIGPDALVQAASFVPRAEMPQRAPGHGRQHAGRGQAALAGSLARFDAVETALSQAGIPAAPRYLDLDQPTLRAAFRYASRLRARYTTLDFLEGQGLLEQAIEAEIP